MATTFYADFALLMIIAFCSFQFLTCPPRFDPHFNAITGLNGSGKSNILDSICFVLGITNLSQVRAGNLSELVYKQGQAGVNKASVTIVFDNEDESSSPVGYEQFKEVNVTRQVLIGGKSKYLINGRNSPAGQVANLFHSVQLNVNNPHFLIMQGKFSHVNLIWECVISAWISLFFNVNIFAQDELPKS